MRRRITYLLLDVCLKLLGITRSSGGRTADWNYGGRLNLIKGLLNNRAIK